MVAIVVLLLILFVIALSGIKIIPAYQNGVYFFLKQYKKVFKPGIHYVCPVLGSVWRVDMRVHTCDIPPQQVISKDNISLTVDGMMYYKVFDAKLAKLEIDNYHYAAGNFALTTLRNIIGQYTLEEILGNKDEINSRLREIIDKATDAYGLKVSEVSIKGIIIPENLERAMAKEAEATREKKARLIKASAEEEAAKKLSYAAEEIGKNPMALELRRMQMLGEIGTEQNTTTIVLFPSEFLTSEKAKDMMISKAIDIPKLKTKPEKTEE